MLATMSKKEERVISAYKILRRELHKRGKNISFSEKTDPRKTYSWRYLVNFIEKVDKLELGEGSLEYVIAAIVAKADKLRMLHRGVAILDQKDLLSVAKEKLEEEVTKENEAIRKIRSSHEFVTEQAIKESTTVLEILTRRPNRFAYSNITGWFDARQIDAGYIAVSKTCKRALGKMQKNELSLFPSSIDLLKIRLTLTCNAEAVSRLREIIGSDLFEG